MEDLLHVMLSTYIGKQIDERENQFICRCDWVTQQNMGRTWDGIAARQMAFHVEKLGNPPNFKKTLVIGSNVKGQIFQNPEF